MSALASGSGIVRAGKALPIAIGIGTRATAYCGVVPVPGCFSAGDTLDEAVTGAGEAAATWIDATLDAGGAVPVPSSIAAVRAHAAYAGWAFGVIAVDPTALDNSVERVNITLPRQVCFGSTPRHAPPARAVPALSRI